MAVPVPSGSSMPKSILRAALSASFMTTACASSGALDAGNIADASMVMLTFDAGGSRPVDAGVHLNDAGAVGSDAGVAPFTDAGAADAGPAFRVTFELQRIDAGIRLAIRVLDAADAGVASAAVRFTSNGVTRAATEVGQGTYSGTVVPQMTSGELPISVSIVGYDSATVTETALVLPFVNAAWGQPEAVGGLVNTAGTEDSATVSPDGEWLIVGTYSPIDVLGCLLWLGSGPADGRNSACQTSYGPIAGPARPRMPGAERVLSPTRIRNVLPKICADNPDGGDFMLPLPDGGDIVFPLAPLTAYGFRRQADGTFAEPFVIAFDGDGISSAFCFTFIDAPRNGVASFIYGTKRYDVSNDLNRPWFTQLALGVDSSLGTYACNAGVTQFTPNATYALPVGPMTQNAGNTAVAPGYLVSDDELAPTSYTISARALNDGGYEPWRPLALPEEGDDRRQPVFEAGRFYYSRNYNISSAAWSGADPALRSSFSAPRPELLPESSPSGPLALAQGRIVGLGQPTFAHRADGTTEMYFVYYARTATGFDSQVARVRAR